MATAEERKIRDETIARMAARGIKKSRIAQAFNLTEERVRQIIKSYLKREKRRLEEFGADELIMELIAGYEEDMDELAEIASDADNPSAKVGAIKARSEARKRRLEILQAFGFAAKPKNELEQEHIGRDLCELLEEIKRGKGVRQSSG